MEKETVQKVKSELILFSKFIGGCVAIVTGLWFFGRAPFEEKVTDMMNGYIMSEHYKANHRILTKAFVESADFKVFVDKVIEDYEDELAAKNSSQVGLRVLLAQKMGVDDDEVHIELGRMFKNEKVIFKDLKDEIRRVLRQLHPNTNINIQ